MKSSTSLIAISIGCICSLSITGEAQVDSDISIQQTFSFLLERSNQLSQPVATGRRTRIVTPLEAAESAFALFGTYANSAELGQRIRDLMESVPSITRECWDVEIAGASGSGRVWTKRILSCDSSDQFLAEHASNGAIVAQRSLEVNELCLGETRIVMHDRKWVERSSLSHDIWPLFELDCTLVPWAQAIARPTLPGQELTIQNVTEFVEMRHMNVHSDGTRSGAVSRFNPQVGWRPESVSLIRNDKEFETRLYGYSGPEERRPTTILKIVKGSDHAEIDVYQVTWRNATSTDLSMRLPSVRLEFYEQNGQANSAFILPPFLQNVDAPDRAYTALTYILNRWGTEDEQADFNADYTVNADDLQAALAIF
jgi:hypothetical protein